MWLLCVPCNVVWEQADYCLFCGLAPAFGAQAFVLPAPPVLVTRDEIREGQLALLAAREAARVAAENPAPQ